MNLHGIQIGKVVNGLMPSILEGQGEISVIPRRRTQHDFWLVRAPDGQQVFYAIKPRFLKKSTNEPQNLTIDVRDRKSIETMAQENEAQLGLVFAFQDQKMPESDSVHIVVMPPQALVTTSSVLRYEAEGKVVLHNRRPELEAEVKRIGGHLYKVSVDQIF